LATSGNGPRDPGTEARLARLGNEFRLMRADTSAMRSDVSYMRGRIESLPTTWQMVGMILAGNVGLAGILPAAVKLLGHP
jgi:hypothetical protein